MKRVSAQQIEALEAIGQTILQHVVHGSTEAENARLDKLFCDTMNNSGASLETMANVLSLHLMQVLLAMVKPEFAEHSLFGASALTGAAFRFIQDNGSTMTVSSGKPS